MFKKIQQSIQWKVVLPMALGAAVVGGVSTVSLLSAQRHNVELAGITAARAVTSQLTHTTPSSLVRWYSQAGAQDPNAGAPLDAFAREALAAVTAHPSIPFYRLEERNGRLSLRYATRHEGDTRGVAEVVIPVDETMASLQAGTTRFVSLLWGTLGLLVGLVVLVLRRTVVKPVQALVATNQRVSAGDLAARTTVQSHDEIGALAHGANALLDRLVETVAMSRHEGNTVQVAIQKLLEEVSEVANGDLSSEAEVTEDMTGAIADAFNYMLQQLRTLIAQTQTVACQVSAAAHEIHTTAEHLAEGSSSQAEQIMESSAALDEMALSIRHVSESAILSTSVAEQTLANAKHGAVAVQDTIAAMQRTSQRVQEVATRVQMLGDRSQEISSIVQLVGDLADRTGVLALNASIEAALAGEAGQGFAIVAREVERLADRATTATRQIATLVESVQTETEAVVRTIAESTEEVTQGTQLADKAGQALQEIETVSMHLAELIRSISMASSQQARGSENLSRAMGEIAEVTQQVATGTQQAVVSINDLAGLAEVLQSSVSAFKLPANTDAQQYRA